MNNQKLDPEAVYINYVQEYMIDNTSLESGLVKNMIDNSSFLVLLKEDPEFVGHYPPEYWVPYILEEFKEIAARCLESLKNHKS